MTPASLDPADPISFTKLRELDLDAPTQPGRPAHLAAASGLVCARDMLYVIADDEVHLGMFSRNDLAPGRLLPLRATTLDLDAKARKRAKPDFEALVDLPPMKPYPHGGLLALGSGSTARRVSATCIPFDREGCVVPSPHTFDFEPLYAAVATVVGEVNIEGAVVQDDRLLLFQRGNKGRGVNAVLGFDLDCVRVLLEAKKLSRQLQPLFAREYQLGDIGGVPLGFTDAAALPDGSIVFAAAAEDTSDAYADGVSAGAAIGILDPAGDVRLLRHVRERVKIEGIHAEVHEGRFRLLAVTDADDARIPAVLLVADLISPFGS